MGKKTLTQVDMRNVQWMFAGGSPNYEDVFFVAVSNKIKSFISWFDFPILRTPPKLTLQSISSC